jgi:hypothetical protein
MAAAVYVLVVVPYEGLPAPLRSHTRDARLPECTTEIPLAAKRCPNCTAQVAAAA